MRKSEFYGSMLSDNSISRYRQLELPIRKERFSRCKKYVVTFVSHYLWYRGKGIFSSSHHVLSVFSSYWLQRLYGSREMDPASKWRR